MKCEKSGNHTISYQSLLLSTTVLNDDLCHFHLIQAMKRIFSQIMHETGSRLKGGLQC